MSDSSPPVVEKRKSPIGIIILLIVLLAGLSGMWVYKNKVSQDYSDTTLADNAANGIIPYADDLDIQALATPRIIGDANAPLKISEHSSFTCPHCAQFHLGNFKKIKSKYIDTGKAYLVFDDFPLRGDDVIIGAIARCVPQESYFKFVQLVFATQEDWKGSRDYLNQIKENAVLVGANAGKVEKCATSKELHEAIAMRGKKANVDFGIKSTPTLVINESKIMFATAPYSEVQKALDDALTEIENDKVVYPEEKYTPAPIETAAGESSNDNDAVVEEIAENDSNDFDLKKASTPRILGNVNAPVKIVEYASFSCPHCANFHKNTFQKLKTEYIDTGKAYLIYDDFPLSGADVLIGALARCVPEESYFNFIQLIFEQQEKWKKVPKFIDYLKQNAKLTGATDEQLQQCLDSKELQGTIAERGHNAYTMNGVTGTPTLIINNRKPVSALSSYAEIKIILDEELRKSEQ